MSICPLPNPVDATSCITVYTHMSLCVMIDPPPQYTHTQLHRHTHTHTPVTYPARTNPPEWTVMTCPGRNSRRRKWGEHSLTAHILSRELLPWRVIQVLREPGILVAVKADSYLTVRQTRRHTSVSLILVGSFRAFLGAFPFVSHDNRLWRQVTDEQVHRLKITTHS